MTQLKNLIPLPTGQAPPPPPKYGLDEDHPRDMGGGECMLLHMHNTLANHLNLHVTTNILLV